GVVVYAYSIIEFLADQYFAWLANFFQTSSCIDHIANRGPVKSVRSADIANDDLTPMNTDSQQQQFLAGFHAHVIDIHGVFLHFQRAQNHVTWFSEKRHYAVPHKFINMPAKLIGYFGNPAKNRVESMNDRFFIFIVFDIGRKTNDVTKQYREKTFLVA